MKSIMLAGIFGFALGASISMADDIPVAPPSHTSATVYYRADNRLQCVEPYGVNWSPCGKVSRAIVARVDAVAKAVCAREGRTVSHAETGDAIALHYRCIGGHLTRLPYSDVFDAEGYNIGQWTEVH
jgi:hypothetical protein